MIRLAPSGGDLFEFKGYRVHGIYYGYFHSAMDLILILGELAAQRLESFVSIICTSLEDIPAALSK